MGEPSLERHDDELRELLHRWEAPGVPVRLDERMAESFRRGCVRSPLWRRWLGAKIPVPAPLAAAVAAALIVLGWRALQEPAPLVVRPAPSAEAVAATRVDLTEFEPLPEGAITVVRFEGGAR